MSTPSVVVLAAGFGSRLGGQLPKALVDLGDGTTILRRQLRTVRAALPEARVHAVVGHKANLVLEAEPDLLFVYNARFDSTNTAKSLLHALRLCPAGDVLWLNGDVVSHPEVVARVVAAGARTSAVAVDRSSVGEEEVKYSLDATGHVRDLSKQVPDPLGEAVGINYVTGNDRAALVRRLEEVDDQAYFERGVELTVHLDGLRWAAVDVSDLWAVEVDFPEDLRRARAHLGAGQS